MNFLYPGFLFALLAVAIPILIHLFNFRKFKKVYFSNVQFLTQAKEQNSSREKLKNLLILCSRILAITFLVFAFARPYLSSGLEEQAPGLRNQVNIYIDNSYSMESVNRDGSLLDEAKRKAKEIVKSYGVNDQFRLLTNDFEAKNQRYVDKEEFAELLDEVKISPVSRTLQQVVNRLHNRINGGTNGPSYLISDFQKEFVGAKPLETAEAAEFSLLRLNANSLPNIAVDSAWFLSPAHQPAGTEQLVVRLHNYSDEGAIGIPLRLTINQQQKALSNINIPADKSVTDTLSFTGLAAGWQKGVLSIKDFPLTFDDVFNFSFEVRPKLKVLSIKGRAAGKFVEAAFGADRYFSVAQMPEANIKYSSFSEYSLIVLTGLKEPSSGLSQQLKTYIGNGGSVVIFPDLDGNIAGYSSFLKSLSLPAVDKLNEGQSLSSTIDLAHPLFKDVFPEVPRNLDLPLVKRYFGYADQNTSGRQSILSLPFNQSLFAQYRLGEGLVYLSASSLNTDDNSLASHPIFLPLMYKVAFASARERPLYYTSGRDNVLEYEKITLSKNQTLKLVAKDMEVIPEIRQTPGKTLLYIADQVKKTGFYELRKPDSLLAVMAFNDDRMESDMHYADEKQLKALFGKNLIAMLEGQNAAKNAEIRNNPTELWKLCLILTAVFLAVEILLIRFFNHSKNRIST
jgi:hypothetical protein